MLRSSLLLTGALVLAGCGMQELAPPIATPSATSTPPSATPRNDGSTRPSADASSTDAPDATAGETSLPTRSPAPPQAQPPRPTSTAPEPKPDPPAFDARASFAVVERLADDIGPREATSSAFHDAADLVARRFASLGYAVERDHFPVPAGVSWGVQVRAGTSQNVIATPPDFRAARPHRIIGAHLDTVPQAPGAEDNASGIGVMLELARIASEHPPKVPVVFVAFGAEEPRGSGDALHHFGSRRMVRSMSDRQRQAVLGMLSLDRVGVSASSVPACFGGLGSDDAREELVAAARRVDVPARRCLNRTSDHWPFEKAGMAAARLGFVPYAAYHSAADRPAVVDVRQLRRVGRIARAWMLSAR